LFEFLVDISQIILADIVLSGDNALIIGMAAAAFSEKERKQIENDEDTNPNMNTETPQESATPEDSGPKIEEID